MRKRSSHVQHRSASLPVMDGDTVEMDGDTVERVVSMRELARRIAEQ